MKQVRIDNVEDNLFVSDIISDVAQTVSQTLPDCITKEYKSLENTKGVILTTILLGIAANAAYDLLKTVLLTHYSRPDYKPDLIIHFEGKEYTLDYIRTNDYKEILLKRRQS